MITTQEKTRITRIVDRVKNVLDDYLPERTDTLKIACDVCSEFLDELREKEINQADPGAMDAAAGYRED